MKVDSMLRIRSLIRKVVLDVLSWQRKPVAGVHILNGHHISKQCIEDRAFEELLAKLSLHAKLVRFEDAVNMIIEQKLPPVPVVAFSFDDGFEECYTYFAPLLESYGINGAFFINPNYAEGDLNYIDNFNNTSVMTPGKMPMRWSMIEDLHKRGHVIGAHTLDHCMLLSETTDELSHQIVGSKNAILGKLGECEYFAFPYGKLTQVSTQAIDIALDNFKFVFSQSDFKHYFSFNGRVINRRHFEPFWSFRHVSYFTSFKKQ